MKCFRRKMLLCLTAIVFLAVRVGSSAVFSHPDVPAAASTIRWVDLKVTAAAMRDAMQADIASYGSGRPLDWIVLLSILAARNGGDFRQYRTSQLDRVVEGLNAGQSPEDLAKNDRLYAYFTEAYGAAFGGLVDEFELDGEKKYGLCAFSPIAAGYSYSDYDDFGAVRTYGYRREHLGHDMMGSVGTPIVAVEAGYVEACGWNRYGGWRIGIRSFDGRRYYYYAHLRRNHPYNDIYEGKIVNAGEVIGYLGMTGYSVKENVNNIDTPHLHFGLELIFSPEQKDGVNQIWVEVYPLVQLLSDHRMAVAREEGSGDWFAVHTVVTRHTPD